MPRLSELVAVLESRMLGDAQGPEDRLNRTLLTFASALMGFGSVLWVAIYRLMGVQFPVAVPMAYLLLTACTLGMFAWKRDFARFRTIQLALFLFVPFVMQWSIGSFVTSSGVMLWALLAPLGAMMLQGPREAMPWFFAYAVMTGVSGAFDFILGASFDASLPQESIAVFFSLNFAGVSTIICLLMGYFILEKRRLGAELDRKHRQLQVEQAKSERLLLSMLPAPIAQRLKEEQTIADAHAEVTVMFADLVGFTRLSERMSPPELVAMLNEVFSEFDRLADAHGLEKIKTIGDAYMVAGGLTLPGRHAEAVACLALEAQRRIAAHTVLGTQRLGLHIGVSTGPVVAGVIGARRFAYDLWGNTVNVASRLSGEAPAGAILVDETTQSRLAGAFEFSAARRVPIKGKGEMTVYQLLGTRAAATG